MEVTLTAAVLLISLTMAMPRVPIGAGNLKSVLTLPAAFAATVATAAALLLLRSFTKTRTETDAIGVQTPLTLATPVQDSAGSILQRK